MNQENTPLLEVKVRNLLNQSLNTLSDETLISLKERREKALSQYPSPKLVRRQVLVGQQDLEGPRGVFDLFERPLGWLIPLLLILSVWGYQEWQALQDQADLEETDSALLSGELPIDAYLDKGFTNWLDISHE